MELIKRRALFVLVFSWLVLPLHSAEGEARIQTDVSYKVTKQGALGLDLHYPAKAAPNAGYPLVVFIHGGGWSKGNKTIGSKGVRFEAVKGLNQAGFLVASVDYRLFSVESGVRISDCIVDCIDAVRYLAKNAAKLSLDADQVFTIGDSAGGHLAQMVLLSPAASFAGDPALADAEFRMAAGVSWYGPCDFEKSDLYLKPDGTGNVDRFKPRLLRGDETPEEMLAAIRESSPVNYLRKDMPPLLMLQGDLDPTIPVHHAYYMKQRAELVGAPVATVIVKNASHGWNQRGDGPMSLTLDQIVQQTVGFMVAHLKDKSVSSK